MDILSEGSFSRVRCPKIGKPPIEVSQSAHGRNCTFKITRRYDLLLAPAEGFDQGRGFFCPSGKKRPYYGVLAHVWPFLVSSSKLGKFSSNLSSSND